MTEDPRIEERLRRLAEAGDLAGLPGEGRPFASGELEGDDDSWAAFRLMKNNKVIPPWSQERIDIDAGLARLRTRCRGHRAWLDARAAHLKTLPADRIIEAARSTTRVDDRFREDLETAVRELNERIGRYNTMVPSPSLGLLPISAGALLASGS